MKAFKKTKVLYATTYVISNYNLSFQLIMNHILWQL